MAVLLAINEQTAPGQVDDQYIKEGALANPGCSSEIESFKVISYRFEKVERTSSRKQCHLAEGEAARLRGT